MKNRITVLTDNSCYGKVALAHAEKLKQVFDAEINAVYINKNIGLQTLSDKEENDTSLCFVMPVAPSGKKSFFCVKYVRKSIRNSRVPVVVVGLNEPEENAYQQIVLPLDINCREKELALWATYFPENFLKNCPQIPKDNVLIHILFKKYNSPLLQAKVKHNTDFAIKMFNNLQVSYKIHSFTKVANIYTFGLQFAKEIGNSVLLYLMPEYYSLVDLFFGPLANKILGNQEQIPVLCLNAREDIFVLCR